MELVRLQGCFRYLKNQGCLHRRKQPSHIAVLARTLSLQNKNANQASLKRTYVVKAPASTTHESPCF